MFFAGGGRVDLKMILHITKGHWNDNITLNIEMIVRVRRKEIKNQPVISTREDWIIFLQ